MPSATSLTKCVKLTAVKAMPTPYCPLLKGAHTHTQPQHIAQHLNFLRISERGEEKYEDGNDFLKQCGLFSFKSHFKQCAAKSKAKGKDRKIVFGPNRFGTRIPIFTNKLDYFEKANPTRIRFTNRTLQSGICLNRKPNHSIVS